MEHRISSKVVLNIVVLQRKHYNLCEQKQEREREGEEERGGSEVRENEGRYLLRDLFQSEKQRNLFLQYLFVQSLQPLLRATVLSSESHLPT